MVPRIALGLLVALAASSLGGCGNAAPASTPLPNVAASTAQSAEAASAPASSAEPRRQRPLEIHNACRDVVTLSFGEDPKAANAGKRTVAANASIDGPRDVDGSATIWLLEQGDKAEPLVKVHVTRGMKVVEIGRSCRTLDAR